MKKEYVSPYYFLGLSYLQISSLDKAIQYLKEVVRRDPNYLIAHYHLGKALTIKNCLDEAIEAFESIVKVNDESSDVFFHLGMCYWKKGIEDKAIRAFNRSAELDPRNEYTKNILGRLTRVEGQRKSPLRSKRIPSWQSLPSRDSSFVKKLGEGVFSALTTVASFGLRPVESFLAGRKKKAKK